MLVGTSKSVELCQPLPQGPDPGQRDFRDQEDRGGTGGVGGIPTCTPSRQRDPAPRRNLVNLASPPRPVPQATAGQHIGLGIQSQPIRCESAARDGRKGEFT